MYVDTECMHACNKKKNHVQEIIAKLMQDLAVHPAMSHYAFASMHTSSTTLCVH